MGWVFSVYLELLGFGVVESEFWNTGLLLSPHQLNYHIKSHVLVSNFTTQKIVLEANLVNHYLRFEQVELTEIQQNEAFMTVHEE